MIYICVLSGVFFLHLLLKLNWIAMIFVTIFAMLMLPQHQKQYRKYKQSKERFQEVALYMDTLLYAFSKEGKADKALQDAKQALPDGTMKTTVEKALEYLFVTFA